MLGELSWETSMRLCRNLCSMSELVCWEVSECWNTDPVSLNLSFFKEAHEFMLILHTFNYTIWVRKHSVQSCHIFVNWDNIQTIPGHCLLPASLQHKPADRYWLPNTNWLLKSVLKTIHNPYLLWQPCKQCLCCSVCHSWSSVCVLPAPLPVPSVSRKSRAGKVCCNVHLCGWDDFDIRRCRMYRIVHISLVLWSTAWKWSRPSCRGEVTGLTCNGTVIWYRMVAHTSLLTEVSKSAFFTLCSRVHFRVCSAVWWGLDKIWGFFTYCT